MSFRGTLKSPLNFRIYYRWLKIVQRLGDQKTLTQQPSVHLFDFLKTNYLEYYQKVHHCTLLV